MRYDIVPLGHKYRGMGRILNITHFKTCVPKSSFDDLLEVYFDYIDFGEDQGPYALERTFDFYKKFCFYGVRCEVIGYTDCPIEKLYGYSIELLGIDIVHDMRESLLEEDINPVIQHLLNENGLCQTIDDVETIIPFQDHGMVQWHPCYIYKIDRIQRDGFWLAQSNDLREPY